MEVKQVKLDASQDYLSELFDTIESVAEHSYARMYLKEVGFLTSINWDSTREVITAQINGSTKKAVSDPINKLELIIKKLMIVGKHYYQVYGLSPQEHEALIAALQSYTIEPNVYSDVFPRILSEDKLTPTNAPRLTAIESFDDGIALIYSTPRIQSLVEKEEKLIDGSRNIVTHTKDVRCHQFDTVFIPFNDHRIEIRISSKVGKRESEKAFEKLEGHFFSFFKTEFFAITCYSPIDVHNAIEVLYDNLDYGRVVETKFLSIANDIVMPRLSRKNISICLRNQTYHKEGAASEPVRCVGVAVRWDYELKALKLQNRTEVQLESLPHYNHKKCFRFTIENPLGNKKALSIVSDVLAALV
jgi:hypothetical protein